MSIDNSIWNHPKPMIVRRRWWNLIDNPIINHPKTYDYRKEIAKCPWIILYGHIPNPQLYQGDGEIIIDNLIQNHPDL